MKRGNEVFIIPLFLPLGQNYIVTVNNYSKRNGNSIIPEKPRPLFHYSTSRNLRYSYSSSSPEKDRFWIFFLVQMEETFIFCGA